MPDVIFKVKRPGAFICVHVYVTHALGGATYVEVPIRYEHAVRIALC